MQVGGACPRIAPEPFSSKEAKESLTLCYLYTGSHARMIDSMITLSSSKDQPGRTERRASITWSIHRVPPYIWSLSELLKRTDMDPKWEWRICTNDTPSIREKSPECLFTSVKGLKHVPDYGRDPKRRKRHSHIVSHEHVMTGKIILYLQSAQFTH